MRLIDHLRPVPVYADPGLDAVQFTYFKLIIISCETDQQCCVARDWIQLIAGRTFQYKDLQVLIDQRRAEIAGNGQYVATNVN